MELTFLFPSRANPDISTELREYRSVCGPTFRAHLSCSR